MNDLAIFENPEFGHIRGLKIEGEPWFVGKDIAEALGYADTAAALKKHVDDEDKKLFKADDLPTLKTSNYGAYLINESGLYSLMLKSKLPGAKKFKRWVTSEVLPSIRKTGAYSMPGAGRAAPVEDAMFERLWAELERKQKLNGYVDRFCSYFGWSRRYFLSGMYKLMKRNGYNVDALTLRMQVATHDYAMSTMQAVVMDEEAFNLFCKIAEYGIQRNNIPKTVEEAFL
jgi:prophage antirepressor-like protein